MMVFNVVLSVVKCPGYSPGRGKAELSSEGQSTELRWMQGWRGWSGAARKPGESFVESPGWD